MYVSAAIGRHLNETKSLIITIIDNQEFKNTLGAYEILFLSVASLNNGSFKTFIDIIIFTRLHNLICMQVLKESLRLYPTAGIGFTKEAPRDCVLSDYHIPQGTPLWVSLHK